VAGLAPSTSQTRLVSSASRPGPGSSPAPDDRTRSTSQGVDVSSSSCTHDSSRLRGATSGIRRSMAAPTVEGQSKAATESLASRARCHTVGTRRKLACE
jgi:hypothetical protein